jgi:excisionase family DNA binding protein
MDDPWLTVEQVAERLQVHIDTVRRALRRGDMRGYKLSRKSGWRVRLSDVDRYVTGEVSEGDAGAIQRRDQDSDLG